MQKYRERRRLTDRIVRVTCGEDEADAHLRDANAKGVRLITDLEVEVGDEVSIAGHHFDAKGVVAWIKPGEFGVALSVPLGARVIERLVGANVRLNRQSRVGFHRGP